MMKLTVTNKQIRNLCKQLLADESPYIRRHWNYQRGYGVNNTGFIVSIKDEDYHISGHGNIECGSWDNSLIDFLNTNVFYNENGSDTQTKILTPTV